MRQNSHCEAPLGLGCEAPLGRNSVSILLLALALSLIAAVLTSCGKNQAAAQPPAMGPMPVSVVRVIQTDIPLTGEWVGTLDGFVNAQIQPQVSGYLVRQNYREGATVSKGQVLFEVDPRPFQAAVDQAQGQLGQAQAQVGQAQGQLGQAQAQLGLAKINVNRDTPLAEAHAIAQSQLDTEKQQAAQAEATVNSAEAAINASKASVVAAQAALTNAKINLGFTEVRSLISGVAGQATTQVGNLVNPQSVLTSVSQLDPIKVYFSISDSEYLALTQRAREAGGDLLHGTSIPLTLSLSNGQTYAHKGHIVFVDRQMNQQTGAIRIASAFPNPGNILRPGQFGRVTAQTEVRHGALIVPQVAVTELQGMHQLATVGPENKVHIVNITLGPQYGKDYWIVEGGISPGTEIITDNLQKLREGAPVSPHPAQPAGSAPAASNN